MCEKSICLVQTASRQAHCENDKPNQLMQTKQANPFPPSNGNPHDQAVHSLVYQATLKGQQALVCSTSIQANAVNLT
eukprot:3950897-Amphidinium_carterae.1